MQSVPVSEPGRTPLRPQRPWCWFSGQKGALGGAEGNLKDEQGERRVWREGSIWKWKVMEGYDQYLLDLTMNSFEKTNWDHL